MEIDDPLTEPVLDLSAERFVELLAIMRPSPLLRVVFICILILELSSCRIEAFNSLFGQHMRANHLDLISIADIENIVNSAADTRYSTAEIMLLLQVNTNNFK